MYYQVENKLWKAYCSTLCLKNRTLVIFSNISNKSGLILFVVQRIVDKSPVFGYIINSWDFIKQNTSLVCVCGKLAAEFFPRCELIQAGIHSLWLVRCTKLKKTSAIAGRSRDAKACQRLLKWTWKWQPRLKWSSNVLQSHQKWHQSKASVWFPISSL